MEAKQTHGYWENYQRRTHQTKSHTRTIGTGIFVTRQLISKWENGKSYPDLDQVVKLSNYFELTLDYLLKEDQQMVQELNLTTHRKRIGLVLIALLTILSISLSTILLAAFWIDQSFLQKKT